MKQFLKFVFATVVGISLWTLLACVVMFISFVGMAVSEGQTTSVRKGSVLRINLNSSIEERAEEANPLAMFMGEEYEPLGLDQLLAAVEEAAANDKVEGIYMEVGTGFGGATPAMLQELRQALIKYKESGKWILAYGDIYSQQKMGVKMQVFKVGTFKSAVEPFINTEMSEANREQVNSFLGSIWDQMIAEVGASRHLSPEQMNALADTLTALQPTEYLLECGLVDTLAYIDGFKDLLRSKLALKDKMPIRFVTPADLVAAADKEDESDRVAVYYAYGDIVDQAPANPFSSNTATIQTMPTIRELQKLRKDDDVKAVVIRVNSGGGSAFASEQIWHEVQLLKAVKPVVISMGGMAASGGYYISCGANRIFAEPSTLTGSIGIFGMIPDATELLTQKMGLHFDVVKTNKHADFGAPSVYGMLGRPFTGEESSLMQAEIERGYDLFISRVAEGRGISKDSVDAIGQGRVWTGEQALKRGLVDKLGNLDDAIAEAAQLAELEEYSVDTYPAPANFFEQMMNQGKESYFDEHIKAALGDMYPMLGTM